MSICLVTVTDTLGPANLTVIERLSSLEVKLYCHGPVGTTELVLYRYPLFGVSFKVPYICLNTVGLLVCTHFENWRPILSFL